jgi:hypothetical protein
VFPVEQAIYAVLLWAGVVEQSLGEFAGDEEAGALVGEVEASGDGAVGASAEVSAEECGVAAGFWGWSFARFYAIG